MKYLNNYMEFLYQNAYLLGLFYYSKVNKYGKMSNNRLALFACIVEI